LYNTKIVSRSFDHLFSHPVRNVRMPAVKKVAKSAPVKVAATKKAATGKVAKKVAKAPVEVKRGPGRPPGPIHVPDWIDVAKTTPMGRLGSLPGIGSLYLRAGEAGSVNLENLSKLIAAKDPRLVKLLK
jgi:hypothetical protein